MRDGFSEGWPKTLFDASGLWRESVNENDEYQLVKGDGAEWIEVVPLSQAVPKAELQPILRQLQRAVAEYEVSGDLSGPLYGALEELTELLNARLLSPED